MLRGAQRRWCAAAAAGRGGGGAESAQAVVQRLGKQLSEGKDAAFREGWKQAVRGGTIQPLLGQIIQAASVRVPRGRNPDWVHWLDGLTEEAAAEGIYEANPFDRSALLMLHRPAPEALERYQKDAEWIRSSDRTVLEKQVLLEDLSLALLRTFTPGGRPQGMTDKMTSQLETTVKAVSDEMEKGIELDPGKGNKEKVKAKLTSRHFLEVLKVARRCPMDKTRQLWMMMKSLGGVPDMKAYGVYLAKCRQEARVCKADQKKAVLADAEARFEEGSKANIDMSLCAKFMVALCFEAGAPDRARWYAEESRIPDRGPAVAEYLAQLDRRVGSA